LEKSLSRKESKDVPAEIENLARSTDFPKLAECENETFSTTLTLVSWPLQPHSAAVLFLLLVHNPIRQDGHVPQAFHAGSFLTTSALGSYSIAAFFSQYSYLLSRKPSKDRPIGRSQWPEAHMDLNWLIDGLSIFCNKTRQLLLQKPPEYRIKHGSSTARRSKRCIPGIR
jgi:hypothetical protein